MKQIWLIGLVVAGVVVLGATLVLRRPATAVKEPVAAGAPAPKPDVVLPAAPPPPSAPAPAMAEAAREPAPVPSAEPAPRQSNAVPKTPAKPAASKEPLKDPVAREALAFVGADPVAEAYWYAAINDPKVIVTCTWVLGLRYWTASPTTSPTT